MPGPNTVLTIHVQPKAKTTEVVGWHGDAVKIRVAAPPVEGAANQALERFLADELGLARAAVRIVSGASARRKRIAIDGVERERALELLGLG
jgi:uncharacterized protein (TIGR00251 family)